MRVNAFDQNQNILYNLPIFWILYELNNIIFEHLFTELLNTFTTACQTGYPFKKTRTFLLGLKY